MVRGYHARFIGLALVEIPVEGEKRGHLHRYRLDDRSTSAIEAAAL